MKKITAVIVCLLTAALLFTGCAKTDTTATASASSPAASQSVSASAGASEAASPSESAEAVTIKVAGSTSVGPVIEALAEKYMANHPNVKIEVEQTGSGPGVTACGDGTVQLGMASRNLKDEEKTTYPDMQTTLLCMDGVAVVVNKSNPVTELTKDQVKQIFTGEITDWADVGGTAGPIVLYTRDSASGTREAFQNLFLGKDAAGEQIEIDDAMCMVVGSTGEMGTQVGADPSGIGYMSLGLVGEHDVAGVTIDGVAATMENLDSGAYTFARPFNLLTMGAPKGELANFIAYCTSDSEALAYLQEKGYLIK
jgi:phosphate transport system substrate-binding protein